MTSQVSCQPGVNLGSRAPSRGPRTVLIRRENGGFGFTLRHFIVYPPDSVKKQSSEEPSPSYSGDPPWRNLSCPAESMDTIFVREVREGSCAQLAGLVTGDRIITINKQPLTGKTYRQVIDLIQNSGNTLHLLVVPKEDDILQKYFSGSAYQPVERSSSQGDGQHLSGHQRSSVSSTSGTEPIYAQVRKRTFSHQDSHHLDRSWPLRQSSSSHQCPSSYPTNCRSLNCLSNDIQIPSSASSRLNSHNVRSSSESDTAYHSPRASVALDSSPRSRPYYSSSQDGEYREPIYATTRPYRFHDTFSKLLVDMWYPQNKGLSSHYLPAHSSKPDHAYRMRDQGKPGIAGFFTKTMKAFLPHENSRGQEQWTESSNGYYGKQSKAEYLDSCRETDILDSDSATETSDVPGSVRLVAHRRQQFESGSVQDKSQERTNMYRHEFSRVSSPNPCPIVQKRAAQFEHMTSPTHADGRGQVQRTREEKMDNGFHPRSEVSSPAYRGTDVENCSQSAYHFKPVHAAESTPSSTGVTYRKKPFTDQDKHITRRISYLKATAGERLLVESDLSEEDDKRAASQRPHPQNEGNEPRIDKLKAFFSDKTHTPRSRESVDLSQTPTTPRLPLTGGSEDEEEDDEVLVMTSPTGESESRTRASTGQVRAQPPMIEGWLFCKLVSVQGKRSNDRSWRTVWALFRGTMLHLLRDKKEPSSSSPMESGSEIYDTSVNLKLTFACVASDYTKRKHVIRLRLVNGTEYLFQADSHQSMCEWLYTFKAVGLESEKEILWHHASVLEKAAAYEQQIGLHSQTNNDARTNNIREGVVSPFQGSKSGSGVKLPFRHRSPTGQSPAVKTRRASHGDELSQTPRLSSVLRSRVGGGWRKMHSLQAEVLPKGASVGVRLEDCPSSLWNKYVPLLVDLCVQVVETYGLEVVGIFRVPGNNAAVSLLIEAVNQGALVPALSASSPADGINFLQDSRWKDVNVVSSLLKAFFRKLPEPLLTSSLYSKFINASKMEDVNKRLMLLRALLHQLPRHHYETLKFLIQHLKRVVDHSSVNKMEARNLAIVFGPTLVRPSDTSMVALVTDMSHQCYIIETLINYVDWLFSDQFLGEVPCETSPSNRRMSHPLPVSRSDLLLQNLQKLEQSPFSSPSNSPSISALAAATAKPAQELVSREFLTSMMFASHRKHSNRRRDQALATVPPPAGSPSPGDSSSDPSSPSQQKGVSSSSPGVIVPARGSPIPSPLASSSPSSTHQRSSNKGPELQDSGSLGDEVVHHTYDEINNLTQERIRRFEHETRALLRREQPSIGRGASNSLSLSRSGESGGGGGSNSSGGNECRIDWQQIEQEWQKAKRELEQDDLLDVVADDPSFLDYLLNRQDHSPPNSATGSKDHSSAPPSLVNTQQEAQLERLSNSLEGTLQLGDSSGTNHHSSSPTFSAKAHRNSLSSSEHKSRVNEPQERRNIWKTPAPSSLSSSSHISTLGAKPTTSTTAESSTTVPTDNCQEKVNPPPTSTSATGYSWHNTTYPKIGQS